MADSVDHLQVMQVGPYRVLFMAETDAMDQNETPVEIKLSSSNYQRYWGTKVMFQMMSSGSTKLCHGIKSNDGGQLVSVALRSLSNVAAEALLQASSSVRELEERILQGMDGIVSEMNKKASSSSSSSSSSLPDHSPVSLISFAKDKTVQLLPVENVAMLPPSSIVRELVA
jgi:hypothetical protein